MDVSWAMVEGVGEGALELLLMFIQVLRRRREQRLLLGSGRWVCGSCAVEEKYALLLPCFFSSQCLYIL